MIVERVREMSVAEFLDFAESSEEWYEYIDGEPRQMTTAKLGHNIICGNLVFMLRLALRGRDCTVLGAGQGVVAGETQLLIPDVTVVCGPAETDATSRLLLNPTVVMEVTSPSTAHIDRVSKRDFYFDAPSIEAYVIVDQHHPFVELYARAERGWLIQSFSGPDDSLPIEALGCELSLREIYRGIELEASEQ